MIQKIFTIGSIVILLMGLGFRIGYNYCRHLLHKLALNEIGPYQTAHLFGYPPPLPPTIEELDKILEDQK